MYETPTTKLFKVRRIIALIPVGVNCLHCTEIHSALIYQSDSRLRHGYASFGSIGQPRKIRCHGQDVRRMCVRSVPKATAASHQHVYYMVLKVSYLPFKVINSALLADLQFYSALSKSRAPGSEL